MKTPEIELLGKSNTDLYKKCRRKMNMFSFKGNTPLEKHKARVWQKRMITALSGIHSGINFSI